LRELRAACRVQVALFGKRLFQNFELHFRKDSS
jgi:hypothetical protein